MQQHITQWTILVCTGEYTSCVKGSTYTILLERTVSKAIHFLHSPHLTGSYPSILSQYCFPLTRPAVFTLTLHPSYCCFHTNCSSELVYFMPPLLLWPHGTLLSNQAYRYAIQTHYARVRQCLHSSIPSTGKHWNSLPSFLFRHIPQLGYFQERSVTLPLKKLFLIMFWMQSLHCIIYSLLKEQQFAGFYFWLIYKKIGKYVYKNSAY